MRAHIETRVVLLLLVVGHVVIQSGRVSAQTFTTLYSFSGGNDGAYPFAGLVLSNNTLYGTASQYGSSGNGTVFKLNTDGTGFATLHSFAGSPNDGATPV